MALPDMAGTEDTLESRASRRTIEPPTERDDDGSGAARHAILATNTPNVRFLPVPSALPQRADVRGAVADFRK